VGVAAALPLGPDMAFAMHGQFGRMTRRLQVVDVNPHRLGTPMAKADMAKAGMALALDGDTQFASDYFSIRRSAQQDAVTRLAAQVAARR
jgi:hypothetical protein